MNFEPNALCPNAPHWQEWLKINVRAFTAAIERYCPNPATQRAALDFVNTYCGLPRREWDADE
jgi:hypothetical protein